MSLVHVKHVRLDTQRAERFDATNPKHDLLAHAHFEVAAVKLGSNQSILGAIFRNISVEQVEVHPPDAQFPKSGENFAVQNLHRNKKLRIALPNLADGQVIEILIQVDCFLAAILIDLLPEIAMPIEQTNRNEIQIQ